MSAASDAAADTGAADPVLLAALQAADPAGIYASLRTARLLVAIVAIPGQEQASEGEMALALLESTDGKQALPAFTSLGTLAAWNADARPVPRPAAEVIAYAVAESLAAVVLDPGAGHSCTLWPDQLAAVGEPRYAPPTWPVTRKTDRAGAPHEVYAIDTPAGEPAVAVICPDGVLDTDWARRLLGECPSGTAVLPLTPAERGPVAAVGLPLGSRRGRFARRT